MLKSESPPKSAPQEDAETVGRPISISSSNNVKLRNSVIEERRKSARLEFSGKAVNIVEPVEKQPPKVIQLDREPVNRNKKVFPSEHAIKNGSNFRDYINRNAVENSGQVCPFSIYNLLTCPLLGFVLF